MKTSLHKPNRLELPTENSGFEDKLIKMLQFEAHRGKIKRRKMSTVLSTSIYA